MRRSYAPSKIVKRSHEDSKIDDAIVNIENFTVQTIIPTNDEPKKPLGNRCQPVMNILTNEHNSFIRKVLSKPFKVPIRDYKSDIRFKSLGLRRSSTRQPLHDPFAENALVLYSPPQLSAEEALKMKEDEILVHVVVDPHISNFLRPHQREGVKFMYDCVTGIKIDQNCGCIMADEMGLGKTLQCIALLWTLLKQGPEACPIAQKAVIVSPSSLVKNWANEVEKWLGNRLNFLAVDSGSRSDIEKKLESFVSQSKHRIIEPVLIISYETFRSHCAVLTKCSNIGLLICDEGHRLKNMENQTYGALSSLQCKRRVLLSGTPIQNDLLEYFSLVHFVNFGLLGSAIEFRKKFENPILAARDLDASDAEQILGREKLNELTRIVNRCLIRRTQNLLIKYLPTKYTFVVCCRLTQFQTNLYNLIVNELMLNSVTDECDTEGKKGTVKRKVSFSAGRKRVNGEDKNRFALLPFITILKNLCNHPNLIFDKLDNIGEDACDLLKSQVTFDTRRNLMGFNPVLSGKMIVLDRLLAVVRANTDDKVVLISNYTQTLELFERLCKIRNYTFVRLDGSLSIKKRGKLVQEFNDPGSSVFIFMLSSKAGGCGLNLIGANRLVMFDPDWNPANDEQAMARVWRDGQKKQCYIYRFVSTGTLEEKIIQRQAHKQALSSCVVDEEDNVERHFTKDQLRDLFSLDDGGVLNVQTVSSTHDMFKCKRCVNGVHVTTLNTDPERKSSEIVNSSDMSTWLHCWTKKHLADQALKMAWSDDHISFVFAHKSHEQVKTA
ncbi:hypothetical protein ACOME3_009784 [Neoechinorhynchus agilis]